VPIGLVLKRLDKKHFDPEQGIRTVSVLPRKLTPTAEDHSLWDTIWRYWDEPFGDREPTQDELPDDFEVSILENTLSADQKRTLRSLIENDLLNDEGVEISDELDADLIEKVSVLLEQGKSAPAISKELNITMPIALRAINAINTTEEEEEEEEEKSE